LLKANPDYIKELMTIVNTSPFPSHMAMQLTEIGLDSATVTLTTADCHFQPFGIVHGGVFATLIDTATFWSVFLKIPEEDGLVNVDLKLNYLKAVISGDLKAVGLSIRSGRSLSYAEARVFNTNQELVAHGTSTLMVMPGKGIKTSHRKFLID